MAIHNTYRFFSCPERSSAASVCSLEIGGLTEELALAVQSSAAYAALVADDYGCVFIATIKSMTDVSRSMNHIATEIVAKYIYREVFNNGELVYGSSYYHAVEMASKYIMDLTELSKAAQIKLAQAIETRDAMLDKLPRLSA